MKELKYIKTFEQYSIENNDELTNEGLFKKTPDSEYVKKGEEAIMNHPSKKKAYEQLKSNDALIKDKEIIDDSKQKVKKDVNKSWLYARFVGKNPNVKYIGWLEKTQDFVDKTSYSDATGILDTRKA